MLKRQILLVEDNPDDEELTLIALSKSKIPSKVDVVRDGAEACDFLFARGNYATRTLPQVVLLDLKLPKIDGIEVLRRVRSDERTKLLSVIILTSSREEKDLIAGYSTGANSYVVKPVDTVQFMRSIEHLGIYWLAVNEALTSQQI